VRASRPAAGAACVTHRAANSDADTRLSQGKAVKELILSEKKSVKASADNLANYLGVPKYRYGEVEDKDLTVTSEPV
jgi:hypothetical protein